MTQQEIENGNRLIAEFMGGTPYHNNTPEFIANKGLVYHISWDWLMQVVEKISEDFEHNKNFQLYQKYLQETSGEDFLIFRLTKEETYKAVIEFIQWYNKNTK